MRPVGDHFYTPSTAERDNAVANLGYVDEGVACWAPVILQGVGRTGFFRLFSPASGDHFYTTSAPERDNAVANLGYINEGIACDVLGAAGAGTTSLFRAFSPAGGDHFYTTDVAERDNAVVNLGYLDEGVACHVFAAAGAGTTPLFRLFNAGNGDHFYTTSAAERDNAIGNVGPNVAIATMVQSMQQVYDTVNIKVEVGSTQNLSLSDLVDVDVGQCTLGNTTAEQNQLFANRDNVAANDVTIYFVRSTVPAFNGCAAHPNGQPGAVVAQGATQWTLGHEVGHVLGLFHLAGENCSAPGYQPTRLMTGCGTGRIINLPPDLIAAEGTTMDNSPLTVDI